MARLLIAFVLGALIAGALVFAYREWQQAAPPPTDPAKVAPLAGSGTRSSAELEGSPEAPIRLAKLEAENEQLATVVADLEKRIEAAVVKPKDPDAFRFGVPDDAPTFDAADWPALGKNMSKLAELTPGILELMAKGEDYMAAAMDAQKYNYPLAKFAIGLARDLGGASTPNNAYTHPAVIANLMRAALRGADRPLSDDQEAAIQEFGEAYEVGLARVTATFDDKTLALARLLADVDAKSAFLVAARGALSPAQDEILFHPTTEGRLGADLLSPALAITNLQHVSGTNRETLEAAMREALLGVAGLDQESVDPDAYGWVAQDWVEANPTVLEPMSRLSMDLRTPHVDALQRAAKAQIAVVERLLKGGTLDPQATQKLLESVTLIYPVILAGAAAESD